MACNGCSSGCLEIISDQCIKYTGSSHEEIDVTHNDSFSSVLENIITYLLTTLDGEGIIPEIEPSDICDLVDGYLPVGDATLNDMLTAIIKAVCNINTRTTTIEEWKVILEDDYTIGTCLAGVIASDGTHAILQAVIDSLCSTVSDVVALAANFSNYVLISDINTYIAAYLSGISTETKMYTKMVPYSAIEYYGEISGKFDITGAGIGDWEQVYLCNGQNGTPDKRGRIPVGTTSMGNTAFNPIVDPGITGNPTYDLNDTEGANTVALSTDEMPAHTHTATPVVTDPEHSHEVSMSFTDADVFLPIFDTGGAGSVQGNQSTDSAATGISVSVTNSMEGLGHAHNNIPPVLACHYIMYIPS